MKYCPKCGRSYTDDIVFCYEDGTQLSSSFSGQISSPQNLQPTLPSLGRQDIPSLSVPTVERTGQRSSSKVLWIVGSLLLTALVFFIGLAVAAYYLLRPSNNVVDVNSNTNKNVNQTLANKGENVTNSSFQSNSQQNKNANSNLSNTGNTNTNAVNNKATNSNENNKSDEEKEEDAASDKTYEQTITGTHSGKAVNQLGHSMPITLKLVQKGNLITGSVVFAKPYVGSGKITSGRIDGNRISFVSYNRTYDITVRWEGEIKGNVIKGKYTATTSNPFVTPNPEYATWSVKKPSKN